jgi:hypothetical protein
LSTKSKLKHLYLFLTLQEDWGEVRMTNASFWHIVGMIVVGLFCMVPISFIGFAFATFIMKTTYPWMWLPAIFVYVAMVFYGAAFFLVWNCRRIRSGRFNLAA